MQRYFLELSYKGTNYSGWQLQKNAVSVQEKINKALNRLIPNHIVPVETTGCGRTDTGVHALQFFAHFDSPGIIKSDRDFIYQLNGILPYDITINALHTVADDSHARFDATSRTYHYYIHRGKNSFLKEFATPVFRKLDLTLLNRLSKELTKHNDFSSFCKSRAQSKTMICKIKKAHWAEHGDIYKFEITADRFLRGMVRAITGTMLNVVMEKISEKDFVKIIEGKKRSAAGASVPACGLYLAKVIYPYLNVKEKNFLPV